MHWVNYKQYLSLIASNQSDLYRNDNEHGLMVLNVISIALPVLLIMSIINYSDGHGWLAMSLLLGAGILLPCLFLLPDRRVHLSEILFMVASSVIFSSLLIDGGIENTGLFWVPLFAFFAFSVTGIHDGSRWVSAFLCMLALLLYLKIKGFIYLPYSLQELIFFCCAFLFFSFVAFILEVRRLHNLATVGVVRNDLVLANQALLQEIKMHKQASAALNHRTQAITHAGGSIMITDKHGIIEYVNPAFTELTGYAAGEVIGQTPRILKSGDQDEAFYAALWQTILAGNIWHNKILDKKKDGSIFTAMLTIAPIHDAAGEISGFVGSHADISALADMEKQFQQAQKMESLGTLVGGIAHDFNNMLAGMTGNLYLARMRAQKNQNVDKNLDNIEELSRRASDMIKQLLTFARKDVTNMRRLAFNTCIKESIQLLRAGVSEHVHLEQHLCNDTLQIKGDATQMHQLLINLVGNAIDAMDGVDDPSISIRLEPFQADNDFVATHSYFKTGSYAHLSISDNGCGIPDTLLEYLFEPFFTTKGNNGTGLGLAMVYGAIKNHHGFIEIESIEGEGTTFHIYIPMLDQKEGSSIRSENKPSVAAAGHGEMILLADDDEHVRKIMADVLESLGYKVLQAESGTEAFEIFKAHQHDIALAMLDIVMPNLGGIQLAKWIRQFNPDIPIIFITGYDKNNALGTANRIENSKVISKPVQFEQLTHTMQQMLLATK